jgi:hypothetical protein
LLDVMPRADILPNLERSSHYVPRKCNVKCRIFANSFIKFKCVCVCVCVCVCIRVLFCETKSHQVAEVSLELTVLPRLALNLQSSLSQSPECWDYKCTPLYLAHDVFF